MNALYLTEKARNRWGIESTDRVVFWGQGQAWGAGATQAEAEADIRSVAVEAGVSAEMILVNGEFMSLFAGVSNINEKLGDVGVHFDELQEMEDAVRACGYLPEDGLMEGRDYENVTETD
jgi:hypothetical protein